MNRLKTKDIRDYRSGQLKNQHDRCALCDELITDDAVLDHDHKTGLIRKVLHRGCNALLGHVENNMPRNRVTVERLAKWSENLIEYITQTHTDVYHPTHLTKEEKDEKLARKRLKNRAKQKATKAAKKITIGEHHA